MRITKRDKMFDDPTVPFMFQFLAEAYNLQLTGDSYRRVLYAEARIAGKTNSTSNL
jgi:hypothetical protein